MLNELMSADRLQHRFEKSRASASRGFTLIELMVVVVIIAILGMIALPSYQNSVRKAHRTDAKTALTTAAQNMERHFTETGNYTSAVVGTTFHQFSENNYYQLSLVSSSNPPSFTLNAAPLNAQAIDACGTFTLNQAGTRGVTGGTITDPLQCW